MAQLTIVACPPERTLEAIGLVLKDVAVDQRRIIARDAMDGDESRERAVDGLYVAVNGTELCGAAWGQRQAGNTAVFWPPKWRRFPPEADASERLAAATIAALDASGVAMAQVVLPADDTETTPTLTATGFRHLADLEYLTWEAARFPSPSERPDLALEAFQSSERRRLRRLVEQTYEGTKDCAALNGARRTDDVLEGYEATGSSGTEHWYFVQSESRDAGVLLLADYAESRHWELVYMGLVPEARGRGWGAQLVEHAQRLARQAGAERIVLAVDSSNGPALAAYRNAGFVTWNRQAVFVRFGAKAPA